MEDDLGGNGIGIVSEIARVERPAVAPREDILDPLLVIGLGIRLGKAGVERLEDHLRVADDGHVGVDDLADLGGVDVDVDDFGVRGELGNLSGDAVGEPGADGDEKVALGHRHVRVLGAVHTNGTEIQGVRAAHRALAHERGYHRDLHALGDGGELLASM